MKHTIVLGFFLVGAVLCALNIPRYGIACISAGLLVQAT